MPLKKGGRTEAAIKANVSKNIGQLRKDGVPQKQAVAIALDIAANAKKKK